jgi:mannose-6-phosphate isomerase
MMTVELARVRAVHKPWGRADLRPWSEIHGDSPIGELWFERAHVEAPAPDLLLKLLFTSEPLSIQVHPNDALARSLGLAHGKSEAWYVLSAAANANVALGVGTRLTRRQLRDSIQDGSIADRVMWRAVSDGDAVYVPAGTIHAIGGGLVIAEIQQRLDVTFRLFDYDRDRELHVDNAVAAANPGPSASPIEPQYLAPGRTLLVTDPHFVLERIDLPPKSKWDLQSQFEMWLLVLEGHARVGLLNIPAGEALFLKADQAALNAGSAGLKGLLAYSAAAPEADLLRNAADRHAGQLGSPAKMHS